VEFLIIKHVKKDDSVPVLQRNHSESCKREEKCVFRVRVIQKTHVQPVDKVQEFEVVYNNHWALKG
jgi:hypothetical protein